MMKLLKCKGDESWLRIYAIKIESNTYVITSGGIKLTRTMNDREHFLKILTSNIPSKWEEEALWREENKAWLERSAAIALKVLRELRIQSLSQKDLAIRLNVSVKFN